MRSVARALECALPGGSWAGVTALFVPASLLVATAASAVPNGQMPTPPPRRVEQYQPDLQVCQEEAIRAGFASQLQPWLDQPPEVLARLRQVQLDMTRATLQRCVTKGLMPNAEAERLWQQLQTLPVAAIPGQRPAAAEIHTP